MMIESAMYNVNAKCLSVLKGINEGLSSKEISSKYKVSRQMVYVYISVLIREGYINKRNCPYEVSENGKKYIESADSHKLVVDNP